MSRSSFDKTKYSVKTARGGQQQGCVRSVLSLFALFSTGTRTGQPTSAQFFSWSTSCKVQIYFQLLQARTMEGPHRQWRQWVSAKYSTHNRDLVGQTKRPSHCWLLCPSASPFKNTPHCIQSLHKGVLIHKHGCVSWFSDAICHLLL